LVHVEGSRFVSGREEAGGDGTRGATQPEEREQAPAPALAAASKCFSMPF
jgi:hypothetical protein